ncbi:MAG TPA: EamA family transporter [Bryobacteraceae bacterium]|nr:EamA family transporter [Bryobacteraceae bacterium]
MSSITVSPDAPVVDPHKRRQAALIVASCTLLIAVAQLLIKIGANRLSHAGLMATLIGIFTIPPLFAGYGLYGVFTVLFVYALRHGEVSVLYPIIALGYVWVAILSALVFHETMNPLKVLAIAIIVAGVAVLGWGSKS